MCENVFQICPESVAAEAEMLRDDRERAVVIVEGPDDLKLFASLLSEDRCEIVVSFGRDNALISSKILHERGFQGFLCIVDCDYDRFLGNDKCLQEEYVVHSELRDIECVIIRSRAFDRMLTEMGSREKLRRISTKGSNPRDIVLNVGVCIGRIRIASMLNGWNLKFKGIKYRGVSGDLELDQRELVKEILNKSNNSALSIDCVISAANEVSFESCDRWKVVCGHDLTHLVGVGLRKLFGSCSALVSSREEVESRMRLAFGRSEFEATEIFASLIVWQERNRPYVVLEA